MPLISVLADIRHADPAAPRRVHRLLRPSQGPYVRRGVLPDVLLFQAVLLLSLPPQQSCGLDITYACLFLVLVLVRVRTEQTDKLRIPFFFCLHDYDLPL